MKISRITLLMSVAAVAVLLIAGCASKAEQTIPTDLNPLEYFQQAQTIASDQGNYALAIRYYQTFIDRHPDDLQRIVMAKYEIAFLNYKRGRIALAKQQFNELLSYYDSEGSTVLPKWPQILARKVLKRIEAGDTAQEVPPQQTTSPLQSNPGAITPTQ